MIDAIETELTAYTGRNMDGKVMLSASHTHNAPADFLTPSILSWGDRYNHEIFSRFVRSVSDIAISAFDSREEAQIGFSVHKDWDPEDLFTEIAAQTTMNSSGMMSNLDMAKTHTSG